MSTTARRSKLLKSQVDTLVRALRGVEKGEVRARHRARVSSRRLRELVPVLQLDADTARKLSRRLRRMTTQLGTVRELDVLLLLIDELHDSRRSHSDALGRVAVAVARDRDKIRERWLEHLPIGDMRRTARKLRDLVRGLEDRSAREAKGLRWAVDARIARRADRLGNAIRDAGAVYLPERLHAVRIAVKKFRYAVELREDLAGARHESDIVALKRAQDALGRMHDLQVLIDRVRQVQATLTPPNVSVWRSLDALVTSLDDDCRRLHARYMRVRPELQSITSRLSGSGFRVRGSGSGQRSGLKHAAS
jgi:CHAD domain-containing protein